MAQEALCTERHNHINKTLGEHDKTLKEHGEDISKLYTHDAVNKTNIDALCKNLSGLTKAIWGLVVAVISTLVGFFIWYVQKGG